MLIILSVVFVSFAVVRKVRGRRQEKNLRFVAQVRVFLVVGVRVCWI